MAIKVEIEEDKESGITAFAFQAQSDADLETLDKLRVAIMGVHPKRGGYVDSSRFVMQTRIDTVQLST